MPEELRQQEGEVLERRPDFVLSVRGPQYKQTQLLVFSGHGFARGLHRRPVEKAGAKLGLVVGVELPGVGVAEATTSPKEKMHPSCDCHSALTSTRMLSGLRSLGSLPTRSNRSRRPQKVISSAGGSEGYPTTLETTAHTLQLLQNSLALERI